MALLICITVKIPDIYVVNCKYQDFMINFFMVSNKLLVNVKFRIMKFLTAVFAALPIPIKVQNKYYCKIRDLLVIQYKLIINRQKSLTNNNRKTYTYIKFSYKYLT
jgi:hypothetical protein